jgi:hypothetical protein
MTARLGPDRPLDQILAGGGIRIDGDIVVPVVVFQFDDHVHRPFVIDVVTPCVSTNASGLFPRWARLARSAAQALGDYRLKPRPSGETLRPIEPDRRGGDAARPENVSLKFAPLDQPIGEPQGNAEYPAGLGQRRVRRGERRTVVGRFRGMLLVHTAPCPQVPYCVTWSLREQLQVIEITIYFCLYGTGSINVRLYGTGRK